MKRQIWFWAFAPAILLFVVVFIFTLGAKAFLSFASPRSRVLLC